MSRFNDHFDHTQYCRMMVIVFISQQRILSVHRKRILTQVIRSQTEEIHSSGKFPADHYCSRCFDHNARPDIFIWNSFLLQPLDNFPDNRLDLIHLFLRSDHRIHQRQISISTCPENRTKLCLKHPLSVKAETDSSVSHDWIRLIRNVQVFCLFISSQVCSTDHCQPVTHRLCNFLICQKQFILTRIILSSKILKLTSQKPNSCSAIIKNTV